MSDQPATADPNKAPAVTAGDSAGITSGNSFERVGPSKRFGLRSVAATLCFVLATLLLPVGVIAFWGQRTVTDTDRFVSTLAPLQSDPILRAALATSVADATTKAANVQDFLDEQLPSAGTVSPQARAEIVKRLGNSLEDAINRLVYRAADALIGSEAFHEIWVGMLASVQTAVVDVLEGDRPPSGVVTMNGDDVVLNIRAVRAAIEQRLASSSMLPESIKEALAEAANERGTGQSAGLAPRAFEQIVLLNAPQVRQAKLMYSFTKPIATYLIVIVGLLFVAAAVLARRRGRMVGFIGLATLLAAVILQLVLNAGRAVAADAVANTPFSPVGELFFGTLARYLQSAVGWVLAGGVILVVVGWLLSRQRYAVAIRRRIHA